MNDNIEIENESIDIQYYLLKFFQHWYYFALFLLASFFIAIIINKISVPIYKVSTKILIRDRENLIDPTSIVGTSLYGNPFKLQNEIGILHSKTLTKRTLKSLDFNISYFQKEKFLLKEIHNKSPFIIEFDSSHIQPLGTIFSVRFLSDSLIIIHAEMEDVELYNYEFDKITGYLDYFTFHDTVHFGELTGNQYCRFIVLPHFNAFQDHVLKNKYSFHFNGFRQIVNHFNSFEIVQDKNSSILNITLRSSNHTKAADFLNKLSEIYLNKGLERDNKIAISTINYIDTQLSEISDSLRHSEDKLQDFRKNKNLMDMDFQVQQVYSRMDNFQSQKAELLIKHKYFNYLKNYLEENNNVDDLIAPASIDIKDPLLNNLLVELSNLYSERTEFSYNTIKNNPYLTSLELRINDTKTKLIENLDNIIKSTNISIDDIDSRISEIEGKMNVLPSEQRELFKIERKFKLNDALYTFLLEKRSDIQITKASNIPYSEILDEASDENYVIVYPNKRMNMIIALIIGMLIPVLIIYLKEILRNKIYSKADIKKITKYPIISQLMHNRHNTEKIVQELPKSLITESFRSLRTNLQFTINENNSNIILITSIIKGEGKSFTSINLATVYANNNKKVVLIDFDLRKAKIGEYLNTNRDKGLSIYLSGNTGLKEIIQNTKTENFDIISVGHVPPNPTELISSKYTGELFKKLKEKYDIIIVDSPPIGLVSDALMLFQYADANLLILRHNYTPKAMFESIAEDLERRQIKNVNLIINDIKLSGNGFGYGYSYGYGYAYSYGYGYIDNEKSGINKLREIISNLFSKN